MHEKIILYGAGKVGDSYYSLLDYQGLKDCVYAFCDKNADQIQKKHDIDVISYENAKKLGLPFVISVSQSKRYSYQEIKEKLEEDQVEYYNNLLDYIKENLTVDMVELNRKYCAFFHIDNMDGYFESAEGEGSLRIFWGENSVFFNLFQKLDLKNVVELACGRGRHVPQYLSKAGEVTLVDVLEKNIIFVKNRFIDFPNIHYYKNNGYDFSELPNNSYTALFTYDAMVHFELLDIFNYLKETYRILTPGGLALFHHSNDSSDYKNSFVNCTNCHGRNFMDKKLFAYLACRAGFEIVEQHVIDWGGTPNLDCISLVHKK